MGETPARVEAISYLRELLPHGSTAHTVRRHSTKRAQRCLGVLVVDGLEIRDITFLVSRILSIPLDERYSGLRVTGVRPDGAALVSKLATALERELRHRWI